LSADPKPLNSFEQLFEVLGVNYSKKD